MDPGLTSIQILDYSITGHMNLEADVHTPLEEDVVQVRAGVVGRGGGGGAGGGGGWGWGGLH